MKIITAETKVDIKIRIASGCLSERYPRASCPSTWAKFRKQSSRIHVCGGIEREVK